MSRENDVAEHLRVEGIRADDVARAVGTVATALGRRYARSEAVLFSEWHESALQIRAVVRGGGGKVYSVIVSFDADGHGGLELVRGECSCPVATLCKHVAAVALYACADDPPAPPAPTWEDALDALLPGAVAPPTTSGAPLAIELTATGDGRLTARLMRAGPNGWVYGKLLWNRMLQPRAAQDHRADQLAVVRELYLLHHAARGEAGSSPYRYYGYGADEKTIDLAALSSERVWPLLDEAARVGLPLFPPRHRLGALEPYGVATLSLDVTAGPGPGALAVRPALWFPGDERADPDARPVAFLGGETAHGVVHVSESERLRAASCRLRLARLDPPVPRSVWAAALEGTTIVVPADQVGRFRERFGPRLADLRVATSSDGAYVPPRVAPPELVLRAAFTGEHALSLAWEWSYDIDGVDTRVRVDRRDPGERFRDDEAENAVLDVLGALPIDWEQFRVHPTQHLGSHRFIGLHTAAFVTEALPVLEDADGIRVERSGTVPDYREVGDDVAIAVSTTDSAAGTTGSTSASPSPPRDARSPSPRCSRPSPAATATSCSPTGPSSRSRSRSSSRSAP